MMARVVRRSLSKPTSTPRWDKKGLEGLGRKGGAFPSSPNINPQGCIAGHGSIVRLLRTG